MLHQHSAQVSEKSFAGAMQSILDVEYPVQFDETIISCQEHTITPKTGTDFDQLSEIHNQDVYTLPSRSCLYIEGTISKAQGVLPTRTRLSNNGLAFLFEEVRFEINSVEIDRTRNVGIATTLKNYVSLDMEESVGLSVSGWDPSNEIALANAGKFSACIPLSKLLGFAEDYKKILLHSQQELVLIRSRNDKNCYEMTAPVTAENPIEECKIAIGKIIWKIPFVKPGDYHRLQLLRIIDCRKPLQIGFRSWELYEYPLLPTTTSQTWSIKSSTQLEKPRYVIVGFQTARKDSISKDASRFDHCNLANIKLYLDSEVYPYDNLNLNFENNHFAILYNMYRVFREIYYSKMMSHSLLSKQAFKDIAPIAVIDCSRQNERVKSGSVDMRLGFRSKHNFPAETTAYCLLIHDRVIEYNPFDNQVVKLV